MHEGSARRDCREAQRGSQRVLPLGKPDASRNRKGFETGSYSEDIKQSAKGIDRCLKKVVSGYCQTLDSYEIDDLNVSLQLSIYMPGVKD